jgi:hypothetical protein
VDPGEQAQQQPGGQPPGDPPCIHKGTTGAERFRGRTHRLAR